MNCNSCTTTLFSENPKEESGMKRKWTLMLAFSTVAVLLISGLVDAGELDQTATPAPTMKTLDEIYQRLDDVYDKVDNIPPSWSQKLPVAERFVLVLGGEGVLDRETGLVWEKAPSISNDFYIACGTCYERRVGDRKGWRLPTVEELQSLYDQAGDGTGRFLPAGHPFTLSFTEYWTKTVYDGSTTLAYVVDLANGFVKVENKSPTIAGIWCVRGGKAYDSQ
jgi:hypothetical protein